MKRMMFSFLLGVAIGALGHWYLQQEEGKRAMSAAREKVVSGAERAKEAVLHGVDEIKEEFNRTGKVVRDKMTGATPSATNSDAGASGGASLAARLAADPSLRHSDIQVETTNGVVTLSGTVSSYEQVGQAMKVALESAGVQRVVSLLQVTSSK
jgi:osmotically-inducible protein OsmY